MRRTGQCLCGAISYETEGDPLMTAVCHCKNCQRQAGSALSIIVGFPADAVTVTGNLKTYRDRGETGAVVYRKFCDNCGSPVITDLDGADGMRFVKAGTFDDVDWLEPSVHFWTKRAQKWFEFGDIPQVEGNPGA